MISAQAELERMAKKLMRDARDWRNNDPDECMYVQGIIRGLHEAAKSCRRRAKRIGRAT